MEKNSYLGNAYQFAILNYPEKCPTIQKTIDRLIPNEETKVFVEKNMEIDQGFLADKWAISMDTVSGLSLDDLSSYHCNPEKSFFYNIKTKLISV